MDNEVNDVMENHEGESSERTNSVSPLDILSQIESGDINVDDALKRLEDVEAPGKKMDVLEQLEQGTIDVQEALHRLEQETEIAEVDRAVPVTDIPGPERRWRDWWLIILASGLGVLAFGGWLGTIGGWWWLCGAPLLVLGIVLFVLALASKSAPWLHLRVDTGQQSWPRHIALSFPIPVKLASWGLRMWGSHIPRLDETAIDDLIVALEGNLSSDTPIYIEVQEDETTGERVQIFLG
jgi:hypothetical protein